MWIATPQADIFNLLNCHDHFHQQLTSQPSPLVMFIRFLSSRRARASRERRRNGEVATATSPPDDLSIDPLSANDPPLMRSLKQRKGGGRGGGGGKSSSKGKSSSRARVQVRNKGKGSGSGSKSGSGKPSKVPLSGKSLPNGKTSATSYGAGGGRAAPIPLGRPFAGRIAGGGTRAQTFGNSIYGSGYPGIGGYPYGVAGRGFPFFFWPVVWPGPAVGSSGYLHNTNEYGFPDNSSRPGGYMATAQFKSNYSSSLFVVLADQSTVTSLIGSVKANCSSHLDPSDTSSSPTPYTNGSTDPVAEQALQYYRASSVVLTLDGYNDTAALDGTQNANAGALAVPLPNGTDTTLLTCLNETIGLAVPLVDAGARSSAPGILTLLVVGVLASVAESLF
ncbi:hypothetical protein BJV74DRAFT_861721 [Russula compacta]|nr:hypothetical protein BJV74DRAFT_861721 [Russula compacta]